MISVEIVPAQPEHIALILANVREDFPTLVNPSDAIREMAAISTKTFSGFIDHEIACMWGIHIRTILNDSIYLWLLTTRLVEEHPFIFVRHSQLIARDLLKSYSKIHGWVLENNALSVKWLRWLGCEFAHMEPGVLSFELRRA